MQAEGWGKHGAAVAIVARVADVLRIDGSEKTAPHVQRVVTFQNILAPIIQVAVAEDKAEAAEGQVLLMVARNSIGNEGQARTVQLSFPFRSHRAGADLHR